MNIMYSDNKCEFFVRLGELGDAWKGLNMNVVSPAEPQWMLQFGFQRLGSANRAGFGNCSCSHLGELHINVDFYLFPFLWKYFCSLGAALFPVLPFSTKIID